MKQIYAGWSFLPFLFILEINTISAQSLPTVITDSINTITATIAAGYATVTNNGGDPNVTVGLCYSDSPNPIITDNPTGSNPGTIYFFANWSNLSPNTTYYVKAYATNTIGTAYGNQLQFTTDSAKSPIVTTDSVNSITATTAKLYGNTINDGNDPNVTSGFCYSSSPNPTIKDSVIIGYFTGEGSFSFTISDLQSDSVYYLRAYAINVADTVYGSQLLFTMANATAAIVTTDSIINITATTALVYGNVTNNGNDPGVAGGCCFSNSPGPTIADKTTGIILIDTGSFNTTLSELRPNSIYYLRTYASNAAGIAYGPQLTFTTNAATLPIVTTDSIKNVSAVTAIGYGNITNDGNDPGVRGGGCYNTSPNPTIADSTTAAINNDNGSFTVALSGLSPGITYYVRAYAINALDTVYGSQLTFTTKTITLATITTDSVVNITATNAVGYGNITNNGNDPSVKGGLCYGTSPNPTTMDSITGTATINTGAFNGSIDSVNPNTTYYVRAYATNAAGTAYGGQLTFTTGSLSLATVTTDSVNNIGATTAVGYGNIKNNGNDPDVTGGFCYNTSPNPTIADSTTGIITNGTGPFYTIFYNGLTPGTTYYIRAYAINAAGISYGSQLSFTTSVNTGIENYTGLKTDLSLFPNPTSGLLTINFISEEDKKVEIGFLNVVGPNCLSLKSISTVKGSNIIAVDLSAMDNGIYFVQVTADGVVVATQKIIILK